MQVTSELIEQDISNLRQQLEKQKASVAQVAGAIAALEGVLEFINKEEPAEMEKLDSAS